MNPIDLLNLLLHYWISAPWYIALAMAVITNITVYTITAAVLDFVIRKMTVEGGPGQYIDNRKLKTGQVLNEYKNGVIACFIFALTSLLTREL